MREFVRPVAAALGIACLAASMAVISSTGALAQAKQAPPKQSAAPPSRPRRRRRRKLPRSSRSR